ncbi:O-methylsterigmatocystin oxidoreductase [Xylariaceae sp. FL0594]|nr:O-methylsterigmatocystin oxidoreductase [Xylariaceae sp. FL0594]
MCTYLVSKMDLLSLLPSAPLALKASLAALSLPILGALFWALYRDKRLDRIPGPKGHPITGIGLDLPQNSLQKFKEWADQYGEIYKIRLGYYTWVVLNSPEAVKEILDKQSVSTSSKLSPPIAELVVGGMRMVSMPYDAKWRKYRTICHNLLTPRMTSTMLPIQTQEIGQMLYDLAFRNSEDFAFREHISRTIFSVMMKTVYGRRIRGKDDEDIKNMTESSKILGRLVRAGAFIEDSFPPLARLPVWMQPSRKRALKLAEFILWVKMRTWNMLKEQVAAGVAPDCYAAQMLNANWYQQGLGDEDLAWLAGGLVEAGSHTSIQTVVNLVFYMAATPAVQAKVAAEIEAVVGSSRRPDMDDVPKLSYVAACVKEILRLCPVPPWSIRHFTDADVTYKDVVIPKGTAIAVNTLSLHFDEARYPDPFSFRPERYHDANRLKSSLDYAAAPDPNERDHFSFGAGRRICPGIKFTENNMALVLANLVWAFRVVPSVVVVDGVEKEIPLNLSPAAFDPYPLRGPKPFTVRFIPRSPERARLIEETCNLAD